MSPLLLLFQLISIIAINDGMDGSKVEIVNGKKIFHKSDCATRGLYLQAEDIDEIAPNAFTECTNITTLILDLNNIEVIDPNQFEHNTKLRQLNIGLNKLTVIDVDTFKQNTQLEILYLANNEILTLDVNCFKYNTKLNKLDLSCNNLTHLPSGIFEPLQSLEELVLNANPLKTLQSVLANSLTSLKQLEVANVSIHIQDVNVSLIFEQFPRLKGIALNYNLITCGDLDHLKAQFEQRYIRWTNRHSLFCRGKDFEKCLTQEDFDVLNDRNNSMLPAETSTSKCGYPIL